MGVKALYPGSFDPPTLGHLDIIKRSANLFDEVTVCVFHNNKKPAGMFSVGDRAGMLSVISQSMPNVKVDVSDGMVADYAREHGIKALIRGLRAVSDYESEAQMAMLNAQLCEGLETVFLHARPKHAFMSSSIVRELAKYGKSLDGWVPREIEPLVRQRAGMLNGNRG